MEVREVGSGVHSGEPPTCVQRDPSPVKFLFLKIQREAVAAGKGRQFSGLGLGVFLRMGN